MSKHTSDLLLLCDACGGHGELDNPKWLEFAAANPEPQRNGAAYKSPEWLAWEAAYDAYLEACRDQVKAHGAETLRCEACQGTGRKRFALFLASEETFLEGAQRVHAELRRGDHEDDGEYGKPDYTHSQVIRALDAYLSELVTEALRDRDTAYHPAFEHWLKFFLDEAALARAQEVSRG